jgi:hypothetical protein
MIASMQCRPFSPFPVLSRGADDEQFNRVGDVVEKHPGATNGRVQSAETNVWGAQIPVDATTRRDPHQGA